MRKCTVGFFLVVIALFWVPRATVGQEDGENGAEDAGLPLEPGRTLAFTATEATWMSVDVSPDGQTIVFDLLGDLYTMSL